MIVTDRNVLTQISKLTSLKEVEDLRIVQALKLALPSAWCRGYGLAAIQIGTPLRVAWYRLSEGNENVLINPVILQKKVKTIHAGEGCLSMPHTFENTVRYAEIIYENDGKPFVAKGTEAYIIQHEVDHMDGILMSTRAYVKPSVGRNDPCTCGSNVKYKKCCGRNTNG